MISINVNNTQKEISENSSLSQLLEGLDHSTNGIAVAVNENVISKTQWSSTFLNQNDAILIIKATQGG